ncbi:MAG: N-acetylmuramoyl-L-alanine amidase [Candidatus Tantalella remota]|nr:N-acetylmuramoyl-L-alanine amidase [Candidatus Tantalella remota]
MKKNLTFLAILFVGAILSSCTVKHIDHTPEAATYTCPIDTGTYRQGIYHSVAPGETLWRISRMYGVDSDVIRKANSIRDAQDIDIGTRLYIPDAASRKHVVTLYPNDKWQYIIIHHSATEEGSSTEFNSAHLRRGWKGVGYHFIIDNGTCGKADGQIETSPRWLEQANGAHCKAGGMNEKGIGVCLVGNFSQDKVSRAQMKSLAYLVNTLSDYYNIPQSRILGHGQVSGAHTECPGKRFPWKTVRSRLN